MSIVSQIESMHKAGMSPDQIAEVLGATDNTYIKIVIKRIDNPQQKTKRRPKRRQRHTRKTFRADSVLRISGYETQNRRWFDGLLGQVEREGD